VTRGIPRVQQLLKFTDRSGAGGRYFDHESLNDTARLNTGLCAV